MRQPSISLPALVRRGGMLTILVLLSVALAATPAASAKSFNPKHKLIVPFKSIAGVKIGQRVIRAKKAWNGAVECYALRSDTGEYVGPWTTTCRSKTKLFDTWASFSFKKKKKTTRRGKVDVSVVGRVEISADHDFYAQIGPYTGIPMGFHTSLGIGLESQTAAVEAAYPGGAEDGMDTNGYVANYTLVKGNVGTTFSFDPDNGKTRVIDIYRRVSTKP